jgi:adenine deaminase
MVKRVMTLSKEESARLIGCALGEIPADLVMRGGKLVNVYSGELLEGMEIAVIDGRICYVGPSAKHACDGATTVIDASAAYLAPGLIDGHTHIGHYARPFENLQSFLPRGTTALVASCDELATVFGMRGLEFYLDEVASHPLRAYTLVSMAAPQDPQLCNTAVFSNDEIASALGDRRVLGMGEVVSWLRLIQRDDEILERLALARARGRLIHGHTAGARDRKLCAVAAAGVSSCHEPIRFDEALERLRLGYWTMVREGSLRQDLEAILPPLIASGASLQRLILVTDSMSPDDVEERGHMDQVVRRAIALGMAPVKAIQAVTLNPATYSGLEHEIGGIAPGRRADMVLIDDLEKCRVAEVFVGGKLVARGGRSIVQGTPPNPPRDMLRSLRLENAVTAETFRVASPVRAPRVRVMQLVNQNITAERVFPLNAREGAVAAEPAGDILKVAMFDRHHNALGPALGFLKGFGARVGAVGLTANLDENTLMVVGSNDHDMARCANALLDAGGGIAVMNQGETLEMLEFPLGGLCSLEPWTQVGAALRRIHQRLKKMGSPLDKPIFALNFLPFVTLPELRITARGLVRAKERKIVPLFDD